MQSLKLSIIGEYGQSWGSKQHHRPRSRCLHAPTSLLLYKASTENLLENILDVIEKLSKVSTIYFFLIIIYHSSFKKAFFTIE